MNSNFTWRPKWSDGQVAKRLGSLKRVVHLPSMENEVSQLIDSMNEFLANEDVKTPWNLQAEFQRVWNNLPPHSGEREKIGAIWDKVMVKWLHARA